MTSALLAPCAPRSLKALHIITGLNDGGAEAVLFRLCTHDKRHQHMVISLMDAGKYGGLLETAGVKCHYLNLKPGRITPTGLFKLWQMIRKNQADIVQTWMYHADLLGGICARLARVKKIFWGIHHSNFSKGSVKRSTLMAARLCAFFSYFIPKRIVSCSAQALTVHAAIGYAQKKFTVIPNGYNLTHFSPNADARQELRKTLAIAPKTLLLGMVARFDPQKDHANLIAALGVFKKMGIEFRCLLVGSAMSPENNLLQEYITHHHLSEQIILLGQRTDIPALMNALDIHILSSSGEAFPNVLAEAMACGTPCVTTRVGDAALIVGDTGWVVAPKNPQALADALHEAAKASQDIEKWAQRCAAARARIQEKFSIQTMLDAYSDLWLN